MDANNIDTPTPVGLDGPTEDELLDLVNRVVAGSFHHDYSLLFSHATDDCTLISACGPLFSGLADMRANLGKNPDLPDFLIRDASFRIASVTAPDNVMVVGSFAIYSDFSTTEAVAAEHLNASFGLRRDGDAWRFYLVHFSKDDVQPDGSYNFPFEVSKQTYQYVRAIIKAGTGKRAAGERIEIPSGSSTVYLDPQQLIYAEADGKAAKLHLVEETVEVRQLLAALEKLLPPTFLRISRKHLINCDYVTSVSPDAVELAGDVRLPLPKRTTAAIRQEISRHTRRP